VQADLGVELAKIKVLKPDFVLAWLKVQRLEKMIESLGTLLFLRKIQSFESKRMD